MSREVNCLSPPFPARALLSPAFAAAASSFVSEGFARLRGVWADVGGCGVCVCVGVGVGGQWICMLVCVCWWACGCTSGCVWVCIFVLVGEEGVSGYRCVDVEYLAIIMCLHGCVVHKYAHHLRMCVSVCLCVIKYDREEGSGRARSKGVAADVNTHPYKRNFLQHCALASLGTLGPWLTLASTSPAMCSWRE